MTQQIEAMLAANIYAVVGASRDAAKYGSLVYRSLKAAGKTVFAINPCVAEVDGDRCYSALDGLPTYPAVVVMVVPPSVTENAVVACSRLGVRHVWMQPGAETDTAVEACRAAGIAVVSGGPCIMVLLETWKTASS